MRNTKPVSEVSGCGAIGRAEVERLLKEGIEMLMSFPSRVIPVEDVQNRMSRLIQHLDALVGVHREIAIRSVQEYMDQRCAMMSTTKVLISET